jgi:hypothetical protein
MRTIKILGKKITNKLRVVEVMFKKIMLIVLCSIGFVGCTSVPMESNVKSMMAKEFNSPENDKSGLYIYRSGILGSALKKDIWVDETCIGESAPNVFFYTEVECNKEHKISTESEFSPNDLNIKTECGKNHFFSQFIKFGIFVGGANIEGVSEAEGKNEVQKLDMAITGSCSSSYN